MRIIVTGGTGLVGKAIYDETKNDRNNWIFLSSKDYNLTLLHDVHKMFKDLQPDMLVHLAANVGGLYKNMSNKVCMFEDNIVMNTHIISCAHTYGIQRLVCVCSTCVFPECSEFPIKESKLHDGPPHQSNEGYAYAKRMLEMQCRLYNENHGREYICLIPTNIYGPHDNFNLVNGHVLPCLIHKCYLSKLNVEPLRVLGSGQALRQFIYSYDFARLVIWSLLELQSGKIAGPAIICCPDASEEYTIKEAACLVAKNFNQADLTFDDSVSDGQHRKTCSNGLLRELHPSFKFTPFITGIEETVAWFNANFDNCRK